MAEAGAWPSIRRHGLRSAARLVADFGADPALVGGRRAAAVTLTARGEDPVVLRDNGVLDDDRLRRCLVGTDLAGFYRLLNSLVYLWPTRAHVARLLGARAYRDRPHLVLEIDTAALLAHHGPAVRLSPLNLGSTLFTPPPRGPGTLCAPADYPWAERVRMRGRAQAVAEVSVADAVPDVPAVLADVAVVHPDGRREPPRGG